jgi:hypothetical protein
MKWKTSSQRLKLLSDLASQYRLFTGSQLEAHSQVAGCADGECSENIWSTRICLTQAGKQRAEELAANGTELSDTRAVNFEHA